MEPPFGHLSVKLQVKFATSTEGYMQINCAIY